VIGIRATAINTGALNVGGVPTFNSDGTLNRLNGNVFYANMDKKIINASGTTV
jgi:hypothetical protein